MSDKSRLANKIIIVLIAIVLVGISAYHLVKDTSVSDSGQYTTGRILDVRHLNKSRYALDYEYLVDGKKYSGSVGVHYFDCTFKNGCVGYVIDVKYSSENPSWSQVDLRKYDKYKTTVYLID